MKKLAPLIVLPGVLGLIALAGCTASHYRKSADKEAYRLIEQKAPLVTNMDEHFTIEQTNDLSLAGLPVTTNAPDFLGPVAEREVGAHVLDLEDALDIGVHHSRSYQSEKENLYLSALSLSLTRHDFAPLFSSGANASYQASTHEDTLSTSDHLVESRQVSGSGSINVDWLIRDVGRITTAFQVDFLRFVSGDPGFANNSALSATFLRPMLRDAGFKRDKETLTQAERSLLYDVRNFTQYRKDFSVRVATAYYGVLGNRDRVRNSYLNFQSSQQNAERSRALAKEGRITQSDLGRLEQQVLSAESTWINATRTYQQSLDDFKLQLGLNVDANIVLDDRDLEALKIIHPKLSVEDSIRIALAGRLDYQNAHDALEDTERKVDLAKNLLKPQLDLTASATMRSPEESGFPVPDPERYNWSAGLIVDPGLDRKSERNNYRTALIQQERATRNLDQLKDEIKVQVRDSWRTLDQAKRNYEISEIGVQVAQRRVEEQDLLAELGRAKAQDQVDAQNALIDSRNQRTQALVTHTIARLQFWNNMGILYIKDNGQWEEMQHASTQ